MTEVQWKGRKSKRSNAPGSGGFTAEAHGAQLHVQTYYDAAHFTVTYTRVGSAPSMAEAKSEALALSLALSLVANRLLGLSEGEDGAG